MAHNSLVVTDSIKIYRITPGIYKLGLFQFFFPKSRFISGSFAFFTTVTSQKYQLIYEVGLFLVPPYSRGNTVTFSRESGEAQQEPSYCHGFLLNDTWFIKCIFNIGIKNALLHGYFKFLCQWAQIISFHCLLFWSFWN